MVHICGLHAGICVMHRSALEFEHASEINIYVNAISSKSLAKSEGGREANWGDHLIGISSLILIVSPIHAPSSQISTYWDKLILN